MKNLFLKASFFSLAMTAFAAQSFAVENQSTSKIEEQKQVIAPTLGFTNFTVSGSDSSSLGYGSGFSVGALTNFKTGVDRLALITGAEYIQAGAKLRTFFADTEVDSTFHYLAVPAKLRYSYMSTPERTYFASAGLSLAQLVSANAKVKLLGVTSDEDIKSSMNTTDLWASLSVGTEQDLIGGKLIFDLEFTRGTQKVFKDASGVNQGFVARVAYGIQI